MGASQSAGNAKSATLYYVPWRNEDVWQAFANLADRGVPDVTFRMCNAMVDHAEAREAGVLTFPTIVCADGAAVEHFKARDASFSALMRWIHA